MKLDRSLYGISVADLRRMLDNFPEDGVLYLSSDRLKFLQPTDEDWYQWQDLGDIILDHDQPYLWITPKENGE